MSSPVTFLLLTNLISPNNTVRKEAEGEFSRNVHLNGTVGALLAAVTSSDVPGNKEISSVALLLLKNNIRKFDPADLLVLQNSIISVIAHSKSSYIGRLASSVAVSLAVLKQGMWEELYVSIHSMISCTPTSSKVDVVVTNVVDGNVVNDMTAIINGLECIIELAAVLPSNVLINYCNLVPAVMKIALNPTRPIYLSTETNANDVVTGADQYAATHVYSCQCQIVALKVIFEMSSVVGLRDENVLQNVCMTALTELVCIGCRSIQEDGEVNNITHEALKVSCMVISSCPQSATADMLNHVLESLLEAETMFEQVAVYGTVSGGLVCSPEDTTVISVQRVASKRWDFISNFFLPRNKGAPHAAAHEIFIKSDDRDRCSTSSSCDLSNESVSPSLARLTHLALRYSRLNAPDIQEWDNDINLFLKTENERNDDGVFCMVRDVVGECLMAAVKWKPSIAQLIFDACVLILSTSDVLGSPNGIPYCHSWKNKEAALYILSLLFIRRAKVIRSYFLQSLFKENMTKLVYHVIQELSSNSLYQKEPFLLARALLFLHAVISSHKVSKTSDNEYSIIPVEHISAQLLIPCVDTLTSSNIAAVSASCTLLSNIILHVPKAALSEISNSFFSAMVKLCLNTTGELLYLLLETMGSWIRRCDVATVPSLSSVPEAAMNIWKVHLDDPTAADLVVDIFLLLLKRVPRSHEAMVTNGPLEWFVSILKGAGSMAGQCSIPSVLLIVRAMIRHGCDELVVQVGGFLLSPLCHLLLDCSTGVTNPAAAALGALLLKMGPQHISQITVFVPPSLIFSSAESSSGELGTIPSIEEDYAPFPFITVVQQIAATMLSTARSEIAFLNSGFFFKELVPVIALSGELPAFLHLLTRRALQVKMDSSFQELVLPIACILDKEPVGVLQVLTQSDTSDDSHGSLLVPFFERWITNQDSFYGRDLMLYTTLAFTRLIETAQGGCCIITETQIRVKFPTGTIKKKVAMSFELAILVSLGKQLDKAMRNKRKDDYVEIEFGKEDNDSSANLWADRSSSEDATCSSDDDDGDDMYEEEDSCNDTDGVKGEQTEECTIRHEFLDVLRRLKPFIGKLQLVRNHFSPKEVSRLQSYFEKV